MVVGLHKVLHQNLPIPGTIILNSFKYLHLAKGVIRDQGQKPRKAWRQRLRLRVKINENKTLPDFKLQFRQALGGFNEPLNTRHHRCTAEFTV